MNLSDPRTQQALLRQFGLDEAHHQVLVQRANRCVMKVSTSHESYSLKADPNLAEIEKEMRNNRRLKKAGLPIPEVIAVKSEPIPSILQRWIEGSTLTASSGSAAIEAVGNVLSKIHRMPGGPPYAGNDRWDQWMRGWLTHALTWWQQEARVDETRIINVWQHFEALVPLLSTRGRSFILFDGRPEHFIVQNQALAGLIDLGEAKSGDPAMDLGVIGANAPALLPALRAHYPTTAAEHQKLERLIPFYTFLRLLALAEWHVEQGEKQRAEEVLTRAGVHPLAGLK